MKREFNRGPALFLIAYHIVLLLTLPYYFYTHTPSLGMVLTTIALVYLTGMSITAGYHRLYSHRSYRTHWTIEAALIFFSSMAGQGSVLRWSHDHRIHHAKVDTDEDPYCIKKGFWYAHCLWLLEKPYPIDTKIVSDLVQNSWLVFQDRYYRSFMFLSNILTFLVVGWLFNDYAGAGFLAVGLRFFLVHHFTWFINSLAHTWGEKPFSQEHSAVNNYIIALLTFGEGYHNYHHTFAHDYRNGIHWYQFDPTKWLIWSLNKLGLAESLRRVDSYTIEKKIALETKELLINQLGDSKKDELVQKIHEITDTLVANIASLKELKEKYLAFKKSCSDKAMLAELSHSVQEHNRTLQANWKRLRELSQQVSLAQA